ncbi:hypothetical protein [Thermaerobacter litoralis]
MRGIYTWAVELEVVGGVAPSRGTAHMGVGGYAREPEQVDARTLSDIAAPALKTIEGDCGCHGIGGLDHPAVLSFLRFRKPITYDLSDWPLVPVGSSSFFAHLLDSHTRNAFRRSCPRCGLEAANRRPQLGQLKEAGSIMMDLAVRPDAKGRQWAHTAVQPCCR